MNADNEIGPAKRSAPPPRWAMTTFVALFAMNMPDYLDRNMPMPIGMASAIGRTEGGLAVWSLNIDGVDVPGRWIIVDGRFVPVEGAPA
jgi:hypothetical protein